MIAAFALAVAAQWAPPVANSNGAPPPVVTYNPPPIVSAPQPGVVVSNSPPPAIVAVPGPPYPGYAIGRAVDATGPAPLIVPPPPPGARIVRAPQAKTKLQQLVSVHDYPASALRQREQGRVAFTLDVGANGRVTGCTITSSSGSAALDSATCRIMRSRARFTPAADSNGMPAAGRVADELLWILPEADGERG